MRGRLAGLSAMALGGALAVLPAFPWYSAPHGEAVARASGFSGAGQLLLMPAIGALAVLAGAALAAPRPGRRPSPAPWAGPLATASGVLALSFSVWAASRPSLELSAALPGGAQTLPAQIDLEPAALLSVALAAALAALGAAVTWTARRR